jgi:NADP-dependent aldehyde dehydrogenase
MPTSASVQGFDPRTAEPTGRPVAATAVDSLDELIGHAQDAFVAWSRWPATRRAIALDSIADALDKSSTDLVRTADRETALGTSRLTGEIARTSGQLRLFGEVLRDGGYVDPIISPGTAGTPDVRRYLAPIGPVAVFSASNFPFAFSVAGGDTASALAAGCSVVVKAHEAHPRTSMQTAQIVTDALRSVGAPTGVFAAVYGIDIGAPLVRHSGIRAIGFTGSKSGGRALFDMACARPNPIPFYGELGSVNPVVVLPAAASERSSDIAKGYAASLTLGVGQYCTNPGLMFVPHNDRLIEAIAGALGTADGGVMLSQRIYEAYLAAAARRDGANGIHRLADSTHSGAAGADAPAANPSDTNDGGWAVRPRVDVVGIADFNAHADELTEEVFGPAGLLVTYPDVDALIDALGKLDGSLTSSIHASTTEFDIADRVARTMAPKVGRLIFDGWPTGVTVCWAMHHGGAWPASTSAAHTSVGATSIRRWLAPIAFQSWPDELLPAELRRDNPLQLVRRTNGSLSL